MSPAALPPDLEARRRAIEPTGSYIVQAPAGSGKTSLLTQRYLRLLARVSQPEEILAITFTNKAASEMRARIVQALEETRGPSPEDPYRRASWELARAAVEQDRQRGWQLQLNPTRLRIQTIDALCAGLARQLPVRSGFGALLETTSQADPLYRQAARAALARLEERSPWAEAVRRLLRHLDNQLPRLEALLVEMLRRRDQWLRPQLLRSDDPAERRAFLERGLRRAQRELLEAAQRRLPARIEAELCQICRFAASQPNQLELSHLRELSALPGLEPRDLPAWQALRRLLLTRTGGWRSRLDKSQGLPATAEGRRFKASLKAILEQLSGDEGLAEALLALDDAPPDRYEDAHWELLEALLKLLQLAAAELTLTFSAEGRCDFTQISLRALQALGEEESPSDLALALDHRLQHLLVDEFQDTSLSQFRLLERLTAGWEPGDGRTLFLVGDPMQSIYRFRDAEVGLFQRAREQGVGAIGLEPLKLTANFRSQAGLVEWFNRTFEVVLPPHDDPFTGAVRCSPAVASLAPLEAPPVHPHPIGDAQAQEAARIVQVVLEEREADPEARLAVLARGRGHLREILPALRRAGLSFQAVELEQLDRRPVVLDLLALLRALLHPADRTSWLALLRAPWGGLTMAELALLAEGDPRAMPDLLADPTRLDRLPSEERRGRVERLASRMMEARRALGRRACRRVLEGAWLSLGGPACLSSPSELDDAQAFFELIDRLEAERGRLDLADLEEELTHLHARPDPQGDPRLQVMTIHKSKGLEFDVVLLPGLSRQPAQRKVSLLLHTERMNLQGEPDLLLGPITETGQEKDPLYRYLDSLERTRERNELGRLLYVAATRARRRLHLFGELNADPEGEPCPPPKDSLLGRLWPALGPDFSQAVKGTPETDPTTPEPGAPPQPPSTEDPDLLGWPLPPLRRLPDGWRLPTPPQPALTAPRPPRLKPTRPDPDRADPTRARVGALVRRVLLQISRQGLDRWPATRLGTLEEPLSRALDALGVAPSERAQALATTLAALETTLTSPRGRWILDHGHREARTELALTGHLRGRLVTVRIDRTFLDEAGVRWILDCRPDDPQGSDPEASLDREMERCRPQLERCAALMQLRDPAPVRLGLFFPLSGGWRGWAAP